MTQPLYQGVTTQGMLTIDKLGGRYLVSIAGGGRVERNLYDATKMAAELARFNIPETVLQLGR